MSYRHHNVANHAPSPRSGARAASCTSGASRVAVRVRSSERSNGTKLFHAAICLLALAAFAVLLMHLAVPAGEPLHLSSHMGA